MLRVVGTIALAGALLLGGTAAAEADEASSPKVTTNDWQQLLPGLQAHGQVRLRHDNYHHQAFGTAGPTDAESFFLSRVRLGLTWTPSEQWTFVAEGQDAGIYRSNNIDEDFAP